MYGNDSVCFLCCQVEINPSVHIWWGHITVGAFIFSGICWQQEKYMFPASLFNPKRRMNLRYLLSVRLTSDLSFLFAPSLLLNHPQMIVASIMLF